MGSEAGEFGDAVIFFGEETVVRNQRKTAKKRCTDADQYGLTLEEREIVFIFQRGLCAICLRPLTRPNTDHDHDTGETRGILCWKCNKGLGGFQDDPVLLDRALEYLRHPPVRAALGSPRYGTPGRIGTKKYRKLTRTLCAKDLLDITLQTEKHGG